MTFYEILEQVIALLQRHGRLSYRALKVQFELTMTAWTSSRRNSSTSSTLPETRTEECWSGLVKRARLLRPPSCNLLNRKSG